MVLEDVIIHMGGANQWNANVNWQTTISKDANKCPFLLPSQRQLIPWSPHRISKKKGCCKMKEALYFTIYNISDAIFLARQPDRNYGSHRKPNTPTVRWACGCRRERRRDIKALIAIMVDRLCDKHRLSLKSGTDGCAAGKTWWNVRAKWLSVRSCTARFKPLLHEQSRP